MKNTGIRLVRKNEVIELPSFVLFNLDCENQKHSKLRVFLKVIRDMIYYAGAPIEDSIMEQPGRGKRRR